MRNIFAIRGGIAALLFLFLMLIVVACKQETPKNDTDTVTVDDDTPHMEGDIIMGDEAIVSNDETIDDVLSDNDAVVCPDLKVRENVKVAGFPLKDGNGKTTFCRPGCDTPTENDPQCSRNLWEWVNWRHYQDYLEGKNTLSGTYNYKECYPWPCLMPDLKARPVSYSPCDRMLTTANDLSADMLTIYDLHVDNGFVGGTMNDGGVAFRTILYDIAKDEFVSVVMSGMGSGYRAGRLIFYTGPRDHMLYPEGDPGMENEYIFSAKRVEKGFLFELIYDDEQHQAVFQRPPLVGEKWVLLNVLHNATGQMEVVYSKVDEWEWHKLNREKVYEGNIVGDKLTFSAEGIFVCDLSKYPTSPNNECLKINREGESVNDPRLNEEDPNQLVYNEQNRNVIVHVDLSGETPVYTDFPVTPTEKQYIGALNDQYRGKVVLYSEMYTSENTGYRDMKACFYRLDTGKQYCNKTLDPSQYGNGFNSFDGQYMSWKIPGSRLAYVRDWTCYCEKEGVCPFEGLKK